MVLAALCALATISAAVYIARLLIVTPAQVPITDFDGYRTEALKMIGEEEGGFVQIAVAALGALWAIMIVSKENRLGPKDKAEIVMFTASSSLLAAFLWFNWQYQRFLAQLYWDMGPLLSSTSKFADVLNSKYINVQQDAGLICFYGGLLLAGICILSGCTLRSGE